jgi:hypothetical protein
VRRAEPRTRPVTDAGVERDADDRDVDVGASGLGLWVDVIAPSSRSY